MEGNLCFKINWASLEWKENLPILLCFRGQIPSTSSPRGLYSKGQFNGVFFALQFRGFIFGGAYAWRGLFSDFYGMPGGKRRSLIITSKQGTTIFLPLQSFSRKT